jgi:hypothetical protein
MILFTHPKIKNPGLSRLESVGATASVLPSLPVQLEFYFLGNVKQIVHNVRIHNIQHSKHGIWEVLGRVRQKMEY